MSRLFATTLVVLYRNLAKTISTQTAEMERKYRKIYQVDCWVVSLLLTI